MMAAFRRHVVMLMDLDEIQLVEGLIYEGHNHHLSARRIESLSIPLEGAAEALRSHSRGSQKVLEVYSPSILRLVRQSVPCT
jgi:hypothetical protein